MKSVPVSCYEDQIAGSKCNINKVEARANTIWMPTISQDEIAASGHLALRTGKQRSRLAVGGRPLRLLIAAQEGRYRQRTPEFILGDKVSRAVHRCRRLRLFKDMRDVAKQCSGRTSPSAPSNNHQQLRTAALRN